MKKKMREANRMNWLMPCYQFQDANNDEQMEKIEEEVKEVFDVLIRYMINPGRENRKALMMECADVQVCIETLMYNLGADENERLAARRMVWEKNDERGYYEEV